MCSVATSKPSHDPPGGWSAVGRGIPRSRTTGDIYIMRERRAQRSDRPHSDQYRDRRRVIGPGREGGWHIDSVERVRLLVRPLGVGGSEGVGMEWRSGGMCQGAHTTARREPLLSADLSCLRFYKGARHEPMPRLETGLRHHAWVPLLDAKAAPASLDRDLAAMEKHLSLPIAQDGAQRLRQFVTHRI